MKKAKLPPVHPGEVLEEEFLKPMGISHRQLGLDISLPARHINEVVQGRRAITAEMALRLGRFFGMSPQFWTNLQSHYDLEIEADRLAPRLKREVRVFVQLS